MKRERPRKRAYTHSFFTIPFFHFVWYREEGRFHFLFYRALFFPLRPSTHSGRIQLQRGCQDALVKLGPARSFRSQKTYGMQSVVWHRRLYPSAATIQPPPFFVTLELYYRASRQTDCLFAGCVYFISEG